MLQALFPIGGALLGGYEGYRRSGGDIGATLLGAGLGAAIPGGMRMAGTALGETALGANLLGRGTGLLSKGAGAAQGAAAKAGLLGMGPRAAIATPVLTAAGLGGLAAGVGSFVAPGLAGNIAAGVAKPVQQAIGAGGAMGVGQTSPSGEFTSPGGAVPQTGQFGPTDAYGSTYNVLDPTGQMAGGRLAQELEQDVQLRGMKKIMPYVYQSAEARSKSEYERLMAAAGIRQNINTAANMLLNSQLSAQRLGEGAARDMGQALTRNYQYQ